MEARNIVQRKAFDASREKFDQLVTQLESIDVLGMSHSDIERLLQKNGFELLRQLFQDHLELRGPGKRSENVQNADGQLLTHIRIHERRLTTIFGDVELNRVGYGARGVPSLHPLDADLNLPQEQYSLGVRRRAAEEAAKSSFDETVTAIESTTGATIPKRQTEEIVARAAQDFDAFYENKQREFTELTSAEMLVVLTMDGKGVVMRKEDLREPTKRKAATRVHKMGKRLARGEKRAAKRMSTVASVYTLEPFVREPLDIVREMAPIRDATVRRPRPQNKRVWATLSKAPADVVTEMAREADRRDPLRLARCVALVDGNEMQIRLLEEMAERENVNMSIVLDVIHVIEYLWRASTCFCAEGSREAEEWVSERLLAILEGKASDVAAGIRRSATKRQLAERKAADECAQYLLNHKQYLRYNEYLAAGFPIATGVIEGACRYLVKDRMDVTGARWSLDGAEAILRLRSLRASGDFKAYWQFHEAQEHARNHLALYHRQTIPTALRTSPNHREKPYLRLVHSNV